MNPKIFEQIIKKKEFSQLPKKDVELAFSHFEKRQCSDGEKIRFSLPPLPPPIHTFIYECSNNEVEKLTSEDFFLRTIISSTNIPIDELLISSLRYAQDARKNDKDYIVRMGKSLARIFKDDYERLSSVLRRVV